MRLPARPSRLLLLVWLVACFVFSAMSDLRMLAAALAVVAIVFFRHALRAARRALLSAVPLSLAIVLLSWGHARFILHAPVDFHAYAALALRAALIAFASFAVLDTVDLLGALAPWPTLSRLLVLTLAQIHALRLLVRESWLGLQSRLPRKPSAVDGIRNAGGVTATLLTLSSRNARDISDALRSRGF
jgi:cobalt/nickel transport system permease protein